MAMGDFVEAEEAEEAEERAAESEQAEASAPEASAAQESAPELLKCSICQRQFKAQSSLAQHQKATGHEPLTEEGAPEAEEEAHAAEEEAGEEAQAENYPLEINLHNFDKGVAEQVALFLHFILTGQDAELNPKRMLLPPAAVAKYWQHIADGKESIFDLLLTLVMDAYRNLLPDTEPQDQNLPPETFCPTLKSLIVLVKEGNLGKMEGEMASFIKMDPAFELGWALQRLIDSNEGSEMPEVVKDAKQLKKLLDKAAEVAASPREEASPNENLAVVKSSGGCCAIA